MLRRGGAWRQALAERGPIAQHDLKRGELGVGAQHIEPVKARVFGDPRLVDGEVLGRDGLPNQFFYRIKKARARDGLSR